MDCDKLGLIFIASGGSKIHTTFIYDNDTITWRWIMESEENGRLQSFAKVNLIRKMDEIKTKK